MNRKEQQAMFSRINNLSHVDRTKLAIQTGTKPEYRPDLYFPSAVSPKHTKELNRQLVTGGLNKKVPFDKEIMGIQKKNNGQYRVNYISKGDVKVHNFDSVDLAREFRNKLKSQGYTNHQSEYERISPKEYDDLVKSGKFKGKFIDRNDELDYVGIEI